MKETIINVKGMVCNGCENRVINALKSISGVKEVTANHKTGKVIVTASDDVLENVIKDKIEDLGFEIVKEG